jgi:hypothetical protein
MDRLKLQTLLEEILGSSGASRHNVYFQPPPSRQMNYPAIVYNRDSVDTKFAGNGPYSRVKAYQVTVISSNPDSEIPDKVGALPMCQHQRFFAREGLNHDVFTLYF